MQKIVVLRAHEWLAEAAATGNFAIAAQQLEGYKLERAQFEHKAPVPMPGEDTFMLDAVAGDDLTDDDVEEVFNEAFGG